MSGRGADRSCWATTLHGALVLQRVCVGPRPGPGPYEGSRAFLPSVAGATLGRRPVGEGGMPGCRGWAEMCSVCVVVPGGAFPEGASMHGLLLPPRGWRSSTGFAGDVDWLHWRSVFGVDAGILGRSPAEGRFDVAAVGPITARCRWHRARLQGTV